MPQLFHGLRDFQLKIKVLLGDKRQETIIKMGKMEKIILILRIRGSGIQIPPGVPAFLRNQPFRGILNSTGVLYFPSFSFPPINQYSPYQLHKRGYWTSYSFKRDRIFFASPTSLSNSAQNSFLWFFILVCTSS